jgi:hypothetical protein
MEKMLIALEQKYGGRVDGIPRRKVSPHDPRDAERIQRGGMSGGDRMAVDQHNYSHVYESHLKDKFGRRVVLLEIGVLTGIGLAIWSDVFASDSRIIGLDVDLSHFVDNEKNLIERGAFQNGNVKTFEFDQYVDNHDFLEQMLRGEKIDVVIDDGCHDPAAIMQTLKSIWSFLAGDFVYFVEDCRPFAKVFKNEFFRHGKQDFPKLELKRYDEMTVIKDASLAAWCQKYIGYLPDYENPRSFNEKIGWKKLYDRNPMLIMTADKHRARGYVDRRFSGNDLLKPLLFVTDDPDSIPWDSLPDDYMIKANHGSGWHIFARGGEVDRAAAVDTCKRWLSSRYSPHAREWCYQHITPKIMIEVLIPNNPDSWKLHVFNGEVKLIQHSQGTIEDRHGLTFTLYDMAWNKLPVRYVHDSAEPIARPVFMDDLIKYAVALAEPFDYCRVDFCIGETGKIYFEEMTHYPVSGHAKITPLEFDFEMGSWWRIKPYYWLTDWPERKSA